MAGIVGQQDFWIVGSKFYFSPDDPVDEYPYLLDMGVVGGVISPNVTVEKVELIDADGGAQRVVDQEITRFTENYEIVLKNLSPDNLALFFMGLEPESFTQATTPIVGAAHTAVIGPNKQVKLADADGGWLFMINTIVVKNQAGAVTYVEGTDWKWVNKDRGTIQIIDGGAIYHGQPLAITITPKAITGKRLIQPQSRTGVIRGKGLIIWSRKFSEYETKREADVILSPVSSNFTVTDYSELRFGAQVVSDVLLTEQPAGTLVSYKGSIPAAPTE